MYGSKTDQIVSRIYDASEMLSDASYLSERIKDRVENVNSEIEDAIVVVENLLDIDDVDILKVSVEVNELRHLLAILRTAENELENF